MNTVRMILDSNYDGIKEHIKKAYDAIGAFQQDRQSAHKRDEMFAAIAGATDVLRVFKEYIPPYKQRYFDIVERHAALGLSERDVIMAFDRMVFELHTRIEWHVKNRPDFELEAWSPLMLEILNGRREIQPRDETARADEFVASGMSVVGGYATALAYKASGLDEIGKIPRGSILLSNMTTPDFIVALEKIAGIATEQGGRTCHAAILAREFNIPCVVGCGNFLSAVQNGDLLVLDAYNGILLRKECND